MNSQGHRLLTHESWEKSAGAAVPVWRSEDAERYLVAACVAEFDGGPTVSPSWLYDQLGEHQEIFQTEWLRKLFYEVIYPLSEDVGAGRFDEADVGQEMHQQELYAPQQVTRTAKGCQAMVASILHEVVNLRVSGQVPEVSKGGVVMRIRQMRDSYARKVLSDAAIESQRMDLAEASASITAAVELAAELKSSQETATTSLAGYLEMAGPTPAEEIGYLTGIDSVDQLFSFQPRRIYTLLGETGLGKTALAGQFAEALIMQGKHVVWFSTEMFIRESAQRTISRRTGIPLRDVQLGRLSDRDKGKITEAKSSMIASGGDLTFIGAHGKSMTQVLEDLKAVARVRKPDMVFVDHFNDLKRISAREDRDITNDMQAAKKAADELYAIPLFIVVQPNREGKKSSGDLRKEDAKGGGAIEDSADVALVLTRPNESASEEPSEMAPVRLLVDKNRNGRKGIWADLVFAGPIVRFT